MAEGAGMKEINLEAGRWRFIAKKLEQERDEARAVARTFHQLLGGHAWDSFNSQPATETFPWLQEQG